MSARTKSEIRAELDAVNEVIEGLFPDIFPETIALLNDERRRLEAELAEVSA